MSKAGRFNLGEEDKKGVTIRDSIGRMSKASRINLGEEDKTTTLIQGTGLTTKSKTVISNLGKVDKTGKDTTFPRNHQTISK